MSLAALCGPADADTLADARARAQLSALAEPGDGVMGALVAACGAPWALEVALGGGADLGRVAAAAGLDERALSEGRSRWAPRRAEAAGVLERGARAGARLQTPSLPDWPSRLDDLGPHAPLCLWLRGEPRALRTETAVAVVGARAATGYGEHVAGDLAGALAATGVAVVSGGAYGIDGAAHRAALGAGGTTVAFLAGGVDRSYPVGHADLLERIAARGGAVVSEVPCGGAPTKWRFLARNRLIAAAADATVVVEAGWRSGSLNTASHAATLGRPLGAVPGPITSAASAGCHRLLRTHDAVCLTGLDDVRELLGLPTSADPGIASRRGAETIRVVDALSSRTPRAVADISRRSGLSPEQVRSALGLLALDGAAVASADGWLVVPAR